MDVCEFRFSARFSFWHIKEWKGIFKVFEENCVVYGDRGYRGCEGVIVCDSREMRAKRQVVEGVISQIKLVFSQYPVYSLESVSSEDMP